MEGGREAAKARLERFWKRMSRAAAPGAGFADLPLGLMMRALSPYLFNPLNLNPLREALIEAATRAAQVSETENNAAPSITRKARMRLPPPSVA